jgi:ABC-type antimicrobial peptide transport system permease subunit
VAADANSEDLDREPVQAYYVPLAQSDGLGNDRTLFLRVEGDPTAAIAGIRKTMQIIAPSLPVANVRLLKSQMDGLYRPWRLGAALFGAMGAVAVAVVLVGLYSVLSYGVAQRRREFSIRTALGASALEVGRLVVMEGQRVVGAGIAIGLAAALLVGPLFQRFLFKTTARDPVTYLIVVALLVTVTVVGSMVPARRAARSDPMSALRSD